MADNKELEKIDSEKADEVYDEEEEEEEEEAGEEEEMDAYADLNNSELPLPIKDEKTVNDNKSVASSKLTFSTFGRREAVETKVARP
jgi:hypothetical protein